jgi:hypothetical protein
LLGPIQRAIKTAHGKIPPLAPRLPYHTGASDCLPLYNIHFALSDNLSTNDVNQHPGARILFFDTNPPKDWFHECFYCGTQAVVCISKNLSLYSLGSGTPGVSAMMKCNDSLSNTIVLEHVPSRFLLRASLLLVSQGPGKFNEQPALSSQQKPPTFADYVQQMSLTAYSRGIMLCKIRSRAEDVVFMKQFG